MSAIPFRDINIETLRPEHMPHDPSINLSESVPEITHVTFLNPCLKSATQTSRVCARFFWMISFADRIFAERPYGLEKKLTTGLALPCL